MRGLQVLLNVCHAYADSHGTVFNCSKTVCIMFKSKHCKQAFNPVLTLRDQNIKSVTQVKYLRTVVDVELADDKDIMRQLRHQYCAANKLRSSFSRCTVAVKNVLFRSFCTSACMHPHCGVISRKLQCCGCVWPTTLDAGLSTSCVAGEC